MSAAAAAPLTVWTLSVSKCDREGGPPCKARASSVFSSKQRAIAALEPMLLGHILGCVSSLEELAEDCPDAFEEIEGGWKLRAGADIEDLYIKSGTKDMDQDDESSSWSYDLSEVSIDAWENDMPDQFELEAQELLKASNRGEEKKKRKKSSGTEPSKCAKHDA